MVPITGQFLDDIGAFFQPGCRKGTIGRGTKSANHGATRAGSIAGKIPDLEHRSLYGLVGVLPVILPDTDSGQGLVAEAEGVALSGWDKRLLCIGVGLGKALQRLQFLHTKPAVPQAQLAHLRPIQFNSAIFIRVECPQVVDLADTGMVGAVPYPEGHIGQRLKGDGILLDNLNNRPLVILEIHLVVAVGVQGDKLWVGVLEVGRRHGLFRNFIYSGQQIGQRGFSLAVRFDLVHTVAVRRLYQKNGILNRGAIVRVIFVNIQIGPLLVFQTDGAGLAREQLHMVLPQVDDVIGYCSGFFQ